MPLLIQAHLQRSGEPLQIPYPEGFGGEKSGDPDESGFFLTALPRLLTRDEYAIAQTFIKILPYPQGLTRTGLVLMGTADPIAALTTEQISRLEALLGYADAAIAPGGGPRSHQERAILIRDRGYVGDHDAITAALDSGFINPADFID